MKNTSFVAFVYSVIAIGVFWWSGTITEQSIYDRYIVRLEGQSLAVKDIKKALAFYGGTLNFQITDRTDTATSTAMVLLPERKRIYLKPWSENSALPQAEVILRVRNGFDHLHKKLSLRITNAADPSTSISEKQTVSWGREFTVSDPDGNRLIFFEPKRRSASRM